MRGSSFDAARSTGCLPPGLTHAGTRSWRCGPHRSLRGAGGVPWRRASSAPCETRTGPRAGPAPPRSTAARSGQLQVSFGRSPRALPRQPRLPRRESLSLGSSYATRARRCTPQATKTHSARAPGSRGKRSAPRQFQERRGNDARSGRRRKPGLQARHGRSASDDRGRACRYDSGLTSVRGGYVLVPSACRIIYLPAKLRRLTALIRRFHSEAESLQGADGRTP